jgi:hypothetical protein
MAAECSVTGCPRFAWGRAQPRRACATIPCRYAEIFRSNRSDCIESALRQVGAEAVQCRSALVEVAGGRSGYWLDVGLGSTRVSQHVTLNDRNWSRAAVGRPVRSIATWGRLRSARPSREAQMAGRRPTRRCAPDTRRRPCANDPFASRAIALTLVANAKLEATGAARGGAFACYRLQQVFLDAMTSEG